MARLSPSDPRYLENILQSSEVSPNHESKLEAVLAVGTSGLVTDVALGNKQVFACTRSSFDATTRILQKSSSRRSPGSTRRT